MRPGNINVAIIHLKSRGYIRIENNCLLIDTQFLCMYIPDRCRINIISNNKDLLRFTNDIDDTSFR